VHALDPGLGIEWPAGAPILSERDAAAPTLAEAKAGGLLPRYQACVDWARSLWDVSLASTLSELPTTRSAPSAADSSRRDSSTKE
jgi:hypothetical protein